MTTKQKEICNIIETLPDELSSKVLDYIEYLRYTVATATAPKELIAQVKKISRQKLEEGIKEFCKVVMFIPLMKYLMKLKKY